MSKIAPLQLLLFRDPNDLDFQPYEDALARAFQGGKVPGGYLASGEDLGLQWHIFSGAPTTSATEMLHSFCHTLTVVFVDAAFLKSATGELWDWLENCWAVTEASNGRHKMIAICMDERSGFSFCNQRPGLGTLQLLQAPTLGERAIRPSMLALRLVHECRVLLAAAFAANAAEDADHLRIFISHAKLDGLPLAHALKHQIETLGWLQDFYDVDDLPAGSNWPKELEKGVGSSLIIMLRTEAYDGRPWCQQEVLWADEYATPAVMVDARTNLNFPAGNLPFERVPSVRIPDGNLIRILFLALREGLRFLLFRRRVEQMKLESQLPSPADLRVFSIHPSMSALLRACQALAKSTEKTKIILYPDPPLRSGQFEAAKALVAHYAPGAQLLTPQTIAATTGGP